MFDNGPVIVIRPQSYKGGHALLYRFDDSAARGGSAPRVAEVRAYESMSNISTGAGLVGPAFLHKAFYNTIQSSPYTIIGDQYGFYIATFDYTIFGYSPNMTTSANYFGFNIPIGDNLPICLLLADGVDGIAQGGYIGYNAMVGVGGYPGLYAHKNLSGQINIQVACMGGVFDLKGEAIGCNLTDTWTETKFPSSSIVIASPIYVTDGQGCSIGGRLPGFSRQSQIISGYINIYIRVQGNNYAKHWGHILISISEEFRP